MNHVYGSGTWRAEVKTMVSLSGSDVACILQREADLCLPIVRCACDVPDYFCALTNT